MVELSSTQLSSVPLGTLDTMLRHHRYRELVATMMNRRELLHKKPELVVSAFQQLAVRQKLYMGLAGHGEAELVPLMEFLKGNLFKSPFFEILMQVVNVVFTIYAEEELAPSVLNGINALKEAISTEIQLERSMCKTIGAMDMILSSAMGSARKVQLAKEKQLEEKRKRARVESDEEEHEDGSPEKDGPAEKLMNGTTNGGIANGNGSSRRSGRH